MFANRLEGLPPTPAAEHLRQYAERKRQQHPRPIHAVHQYVVDAAEVEVAVHPIQNSSAECQRKQYFYSVVDDVSYFHTDVMLSVVRLRRRRPAA